jgi:hypothetical protein
MKVMRSGSATSQRERTSLAKSRHDIGDITASRDERQQQVRFAPALARRLRLLT